jgi:hypothetical protein
MKCDSRASLLACTLASPCFGREPKARVATIIMLVVPSLEKYNKLEVLLLLMH